MSMYLKESFLSKLRYVIAVLLVVFMVFGFGYYNHIHVLNAKVSAYENAKTQIDPLRACHVFLAMNASAAPYNPYNKGMYECSNLAVEKNNFGTAIYNQKAIGVKNSVVDSEVALRIKDDFHTTEKTKEELAAEEVYLSKFIQLSDLVSELYGSNLDEKTIRKIKQLYREKGLFLRDYPTHKLKIEHIALSNGVFIIKLTFLGK